MVPPKLTPSKTKIPVVMQQGGRSQRHSFQVRRQLAVIPLLYNGSTRIRLLALACVRPFNSEVHSVSALLPCSHPAVIPDRVLGFLKIALKRTRPRQRFLRSNMLGGIV